MPWIFRRNAGFRSRRTRKSSEIVEIVIHESAGRALTVDPLIKALKNKGLGVHYAVEWGGDCYQLADDRDLLAHAGSPHNARSIGVELISPYYPAYAPADNRWIPAVWAHKARYAIPPLVALESLYSTVRRLSDRYDIHAMPGLVDGRAPAFRWGRYLPAPVASKRPPGIVAHARWPAHADGLFPEHYIVLRLAGFSPSDALDATIAAASSGQRWTSLPLLPESNHV